MKSIIIKTRVANPITDGYYLVKITEVSDSFRRMTQYGSREIVSITLLPVGASKGFDKVTEGFILPDTEHFLNSRLGRLIEASDPSFEVGDEYNVCELVGKRLIVKFDTNDKGYVKAEEFEPKDADINIVPFEVKKKARKKK